MLTGQIGQFEVLSADANNSVDRYDQRHSSSLLFVIPKGITVKEIATVRASEEGTGRYIDGDWDGDKDNQTETETWTARGSAKVGDNRRNVSRKEKK